MDQLERLVAIEAIKNVKARYWYRRVDGRWLISAVFLTRLRADGNHPNEDTLRA